MSKILFIGDPHIRHTHLSEGKSLLRWVEDICEQERPDLIVNLGDTFDDHAVIRAEVLSTVNSHLLRLSDMKIPVVMVLGNHDMWRPNSSQYHALEVFKGRKNLVIVDSTIVVDGITYVPYLPSGVKWPDITTSIAVTHNTFLGADYGFKVADAGLDQEESPCDIIVSGHIHKRQTLKKVLYPGTPMPMSASDVDQVKGLMILDTDTLTSTFIESPFPGWRSITISAADARDLNLDPKFKWIIKLQGPRVEIKAFIDSEKYKDIVRSAQVSVKLDPSDRSKVERTSISSASLIGMVNQYIDNVYDGSTDKNVLKNTIESYMEKT